MVDISEGSAELELSAANSPLQSPNCPALDGGLRHGAGEWMLLVVVG